MCSPDLPNTYSKDMAFTEERHCIQQRCSFGSSYGHHPVNSVRTAMKSRLYHCRDDLEAFRADTLSHGVYVDELHNTMKLLCNPVLHP